MGTQPEKKPLLFEEAKAIILDWLANRKFKQSKIELLDDMLNDMADAMVEGEFKLRDDNLFEYRFIHPLLDGDGQVHKDRVVLKDRIDYNRGVKPHLRGVKNQDTQGQMMAYACGLSGLHMNELGKLDTRDSGFIRNYAALFF